jgi:hypothetical protein
MPINFAIIYLVSLSHPANLEEAVLIVMVDNENSDKIHKSMVLK